MPYDLIWDHCKNCCKVYKFCKSYSHHGCRKELIKSKKHGNCQEYIWCYINFVMSDFLRGKPGSQYQQTDKGEYVLKDWGQIYQNSNIVQSFCGTSDATFLTWAFFSAMWWSYTRWPLENGYKIRSTFLGAYIFHIWRPFLCLHTFIDWGRKTPCCLPS